jgi:hypothetical protein
MLSGQHTEAGQHPKLMTGSIDKLYEETYNGRLLEIYRFTQSAPGVVTASSITARVDGYELPSRFDCRT